MTDQILRKQTSMWKILQFEKWIAWLSVAMAPVWAFIAPIKHFVIAAALLVIIDLITGTLAAKKRKESIHSRGLRRTVEKFLVYFLAMLAAEAMRVVFIPAAPFTYVVAFGICVTEFQSLVENVEVITGVNLWSRIKQLIQSIPQK